MAADQISEGSSQARAETVLADGGGDGGVRDRPAGGAGACVSLIFADLRGQLGQLGDLMPRRFGVVRTSLGRQIMAAASAGGR